VSDRRLAPLGAIMLAVVCAGPAPALAQGCDDETIDAIANDGSVIRMRSGAVFRVDSSDRIDASLWSTLDDVLVCKDETEIINKDKDGERVSVRRLRR
jgi:hypothetical protein